ncbi:MAG: DUF4845 domain-containing protein [Moraxella sp.]|jgi:hypothetical protein
MNLPSHQRGASVSGILIMTMLIVVCIKIGLAIIPAQIGHYQLKKSVITALKKSNDNKETGKQFINGLSSQWNINGYQQKPDEVIIIEDELPGSLSIKLKYTEVSNFFGDVDIVNRFEDTITAQDAQAAK